MAEVATKPDPLAEQGDRLDTREQEIVKGQSEAQSKAEERYAAEDAPVLAGQQKAAEELSAAVNQPRPKFAPPVNQAAHLDPKQLNESAGIFMTLGALGGLLTRRPMTAALAAMTGAIEGVKAGDETQFKQANDAFKQNYDEALKNYEAMMKEQDSIIKDKSLDLTAKDQLLKIAAARHGQDWKRVNMPWTTQMKLYASERKSYDQAVAQREKFQELLEKQREWFAMQRSNQMALAAATGRTGAANWSDKEHSLLAELALHNVNLPVGMRSQQQIHATLQGLLEARPNLTTAEIAQEIKDGKLALTAETAEARTAGTITGKVEFAISDIQEMSPLVLSASKKVPQKDFIPVNKLLVAYSEGIVQDPNQRQLAVYINSMLNAYDVLAARGGTDIEKRKAAHSLLLKADSPDSLKAGVDAFMDEAYAADRAAKSTIKKVSGGGRNNTTAVYWDDLK